MKFLESHNVEIGDVFKNIYVELLKFLEGLNVETSNVFSKTCGMQNLTLSININYRYSNV